MSKRELSKTWRKEWRLHFGAFPPFIAHSFDAVEVEAVAEHFFDAGVKRGLQNAARHLTANRSSAQNAVDRRARNWKPKGRKQAVKK